ALRALVPTYHAVGEVDGVCGVDPATVPGVDLITADGAVVEVECGSAFGSDPATVSVEIIVTPAVDPHAVQVQRCSRVEDVQDPFACVVTVAVDPGYVGPCARDR